jgi:hypothetical protein
MVRMTTRTSARRWRISRVASTPVQHRHGHVHQDHVGVQFLGQLHCFVTVGRLAHHVDSLSFEGAA